MIWFVISIILTIVAFISLGLEEETVAYTDSWGREDTRQTTVFKLRKRQFCAIFFLLIMLIGCVGWIPANHVGIVYSPFGGTKDYTLSEGLYTKIPFDKVYKMSTETQTLQITDVTTQTKDAQYVTSILDVKYSVDASNADMVFKQYRTLKNMSDTLIGPTTQRVLELITTRYNVIDILGEARSDVYNELIVDLDEEFAKYGVKFDNISILDMDAGAGIEQAIEQEAIAKKAVETTEQNLRKAETEAKQQSVKAQAEQDAAKIEAETKIIQAEAEKQANELLNQTLTDELLQKEWIEKWNGQMPTYYAGADNGAGVIFNAG